MVTFAVVPVVLQGTFVLVTVVLLDTAVLLAVALLDIIVVTEVARAQRGSRCGHSPSGGTCVRAAEPEGAQSGYEGRR